jgi:hypothetical protein
MNMYLDEQLVRDRLDDARAQAAQSAMVLRLRPTRLPVRVALGLALIRAGYWIAGRDTRRAAQPRRATA